MQSQFAFRSFALHAIVGFGIGSAQDSQEAHDGDLQLDLGTSVAAGDDGHAEQHEEQVAAQSLREENEALKRQLKTAMSAVSGPPVPGLPPPPGIASLGPGSSPQTSVAQPVQTDAQPEAPHGHQDQLAAFRAFAEGVTHPGAGVALSTTGARMGLFSQDPVIQAAPGLQAGPSVTGHGAATGQPQRVMPGNCIQAYTPHTPLLLHAAPNSDKPTRGVEAMLQLTRTAQSRAELGDSWWSVKLWSETMTLCSRGEVSPQLVEPCAPMALITTRPDAHHRNFLLSLLA